MREPAWFWIIGGAIGVIGLIGWEDFKQKVNGASDVAEGNNGASDAPANPYGRGVITEDVASGMRQGDGSWEPVVVVGADEDGIEYGTREWVYSMEAQTIHGYSFDAEVRRDFMYEAVRSGGSGMAWMRLGADTYPSLEEAQARATEELERANARINRAADPFPEGVDGRGGYETELTAPPTTPSPTDYSDALANVQIQDVGDAYSSVNTTINTTDLEGAVDAVIP
jgi:hypothetical protein